MVCAMFINGMVKRHTSWLKEIDIETLYIWSIPSPSSIRTLCPCTGIPAGRSRLLQGHRILYRIYYHLVVQEHIPVDLYNGIGYNVVTYFIV